MSKSLQKGIIFAVCILLVCALGVTLFIFDGTGGAVTGQEGQASNVAQNKNTTTYTHGSYIERDVPSGATPVNNGTDFVAAVSKDQDISITGSFELTSSQSFLKKDNNGNISDDPATSGSALVYSSTIYGNGYNITITGSQDITDNTAVWDCGPNGYGDAANVYGGLVGKLTGQIYDLNVTMKSGTMEKIKGNDGGDRWLDVGVIAGIVDDVNARIENCSVTIPANTQITALKSPISNVGWGQSSAGTQYVRAAGIAAELNNGTIVNCTVTNNGCISAGLQENKDDNSITNGYYGAAANAVAWVNNGTLNNIIVKGSGKLIGLKTAAISVVNNSNISPPPTTNAYNGYTGTYEFRHGDDGGNWSTASMYVSGARQAIANFYQASNATTRGGANKDQTSHELTNSGTTLTVNPSTYTIYFDPKKSSDDTRLAVLFNNENYSAGAEYELYGASGQISNAQISGANGKVLARNLPATPSTWNSGNNFTASVQIAFDPSSYAALTKYDHGYVDPDNRTTNGTPIGTGEDFEAEFSPSGTISGTDYYLTNDIVITGFTGKEFSGTLDGNGHTIFITGANTCAAQHIGGIVGTLTGTIKNVRVVLVNSVTANTSVSNANVGLVAGHINGGSLINVSVDIPTNVTLSHVGTANDSSLGGIAGSAVSGATFTNVTMNFNGTLSNTRNNDYWPYTSAFVGKPYFKDSANSSANCATFNNIIIRGNGTFASQSNSTTEPPYYAAIGIIQHKGVTDSTAAVYNVNGLIYDFNPQFANDQGATTGNHGACYGLFVNNNNNNATQVQYYDRLVNYGSGGVYNASGEPIEAYAFNDNGNAPVPNPSKIKNITETVTGVTGSAVKAYFMPGDSASENLTLVASASNWNGVTQLQLDGAAPAVTSADDGSNKVVNVAKSTAVNISGENLTLSPYNPYTVITASLVTDTKVYDGNPFAAQVSFADSTGAVTLTAGDDYNITYTDGGNTGETNANASGGTYSLTVTLKGTASDGTQYVFDAQGTKTKTFTYTITPLEVTGTWSVRGLEITYGDSAPDYDQYISIKLTNEGTIPGGLTATDITGSGFTSNYTSGTRAGETVTITAGTFTVGSGFTASNYNFSGITGSGSVEVQKREITISAADIEDPAVGHIVAIYGGTNYVTSQADLQNLLTRANVSDYVENVYGTDEIGFTITAVAHEQTGDGATYAPGEAVQDGEWAKLPAKDTYYITVTSANNNYTVAENNYFKYQVSPAELVVTGVVWDDTALDTITYDGQKHTAKLKVTGLVGEDTYDSALTVSLTLNSGAVENGVNAGTYTVDVEVNEDDKYYDLGVSGDSAELTLTISPIKLTPTDISGTFTEYTSSNLPTGASFVTSGILAADSGVTVAVTSWVNDPSTNVVGSGSYVAVNTYTANLAIQGDDNGNYALSATTAEFEITAYNLAKATITVEASGLVYDGTEKTATVTVKAGEADITDLVTITGNKATNAGDSYTVSISSKDGNTTGSKNADTTWSIAKADYNMEGVTFEDGSITYDGESHTLTVSGELPTGEDGIKVTVEYTAANGGEVNITNVGSVKITATFATTSTNYNTPAAKTATLTIEKKAVTIEWSIGDIIQGTDPDKVKDTAKVTNKGGILDGDTYEFTVTLPLKDGSGDYTTTTLAGTVINVTPSLTFTDPTDAGNYNITYSPVTLEWEVQQPEVAISVTAPTVEKTYAAGFVTEDEFLSNFTGTFTATSLSAVISADNFDITITKDGADGTTVEAGRLDVGTYTVTISAAAGSQYTIADGSTLTYTYTVTAEQWTATVAAPEDGLTYNGLDQFSSLVITPGANNTCDGAPTIAAVVTGGEMKNAGTYNVTLQLQTADGAYTGGNFVLNSGSEDYSAQIEIAKLKVEIEWEANGDLVYNGQAHTLTATITNKVETDNVTAIVEKHSGDNINVAEGGFSYTITGLENNDLGNYTFEGVSNITSQAFNIIPATLTVEGKEGATLSREYDGNTTAANSFLTEKYVTITGGVSGENIYGMLNASLTEGGEIKNAGAYTITVTFNAEAEGAGNYSVGDFTSLEIVYTVNAKTITITFGGYEDLTYNGQARTLTATADFVSGESIDLNALIAYTGDITNGEAVNAGSYTATITKAQIEKSNVNYTLAAESATQEFTISPATLTLTQKEGAQLSRVYDGTVTEASAFVSADYFTVSDYMDGGNEYALFTAAVAEGLTIQNADSYTINITINSGAEGADNYTCEPFAITYEVTPIQWTASVAAPEGGLTYDGTNKLGNLVITPGDNAGTGLEGAPEIVATVTGGSMVNAGTYTVTLQLQTAEDAVYEGGNFTLDANSAEIEIAKRIVEIIWAEASDFTYNGLAHTLTATVNNKVGEDEVNATVQLGGDNVSVTEEGFTYTVTGLEGTAAENYTIVGAENLTSETQHIARATLTVQFEGISGLVYTGTEHNVTANATGWQKDDSFDLNSLITIGGADTQVLNAGDYTATITKEALETALDNYTLAQDATVDFTIAPKPITITFTANDGANTINFDVAGSVTVGAWTADGSDPNKATLTLSDGTTDITLTVEASEALPMFENDPALLLLLGGAPYEGTPYGTEVKGGSLTVVSADKNYVFEVAQAITLNITPAISVGLKADVQTKLGLTDVLKTDHNADYFKNNYLKVTGKGGEELTGGTLEVTITTPEGVELIEGVIKHAGTYTVTAVYTPEGAEASAERPTFSFEFTVMPVEVTSVTYSGEPLVYGKLSASGGIAVTVEYADGKKAENVTAQYTSEHVSTGNWLKAGNTQVTVSYTGDNRDYAAVTKHVTLTVAQKTITATINYGEQSGTELTLTYNGSVGYTIGAELNDVLSGDGVSAEVLQSFIDVAAYEVEITLDGNDKDNYTVEGEYTVTITPADVTYKWNFADGAKITYGDSVEAVTALAVMPDGALLGVEGKVAFQVSVGDYSATTNAGTKVTFTVSYTLPEGANKDNYNINITAADGNTLIVDKATLTLSIADAKSLTKVYDGEAVTFASLLTAGNVSVEGMKNGENAFTLRILAISGTDEMTNAGAYNGSVSVIENCNYTAEAIEITYTVTPKPIDVAWTNTEFTYDGTAHKPTATATDLVGEDTLTLTVTGEQTNAGSYTATVAAFEQGNYKLESDSTHTFTIKKAAAALAIKDYDAIQASVYKGSAFVVTPLLNGAEDTQGIVEVEFFDKTDSSATVAVQEIKNAGTYTVTLTVNNANYEYAQRYFTVTVSPKSIDVAWGNTEFTYNGTAQKPTATATGLVEGDSLTLTVTGAQTNAGSYTATVAAFEQGNYKLESTSTKAFTIAKADLTVTPASLEIRERETDVMQAFAEGEDLVEAFAGRISVSGVSGTVSYTVTIAGENNYDDDGLLTVGAHTFTIDAGDNYNAASVSVTVIATPVVTVIASVEGELVYNGSAFEISYALKEGAPEDVSMDDITVTASVETIVNAGEYTVTFTVAGSNEDYDYVVQDASGNAALTFTIARRGLDVAEVAEAVYGNLQVSGTLVTGTHTAFVAYNDEEIELIVNVKAAVLSRAAAEYLDAGEHEVTIALANENGNFSLNGATLNPETEKMEVQSTLDVAPKSVTVGYTTSSGVYDAKGISITLDKFEDMLIEGDDPAVNIYINDAPYTGKVVLDAGDYTVRYESADPNYAFAPMSATFTVAPKRVTPNFDLNTGSGSLQITGGGKLEIEEGEETDIVAAIDSFMQSSGVSEEEMSISVSGDLKLEDMATWAPGTYTVTVTLSGNHSGSMQFTVEVSEKIELPPPVQPELPETPAEAGSGNDWVLPLVIAIVALIDLALLVAIGVAAKKRA